MRRILACCVGLLLGAGLAAPPALSGSENGFPNLFAYPPSWLVGPVTGPIRDYDPVGPGKSVVDGCLAEERAAGAERCLRFMTKLVNFDVPALRLALRVEPTGRNVYQVVASTGGRREYLPAGTFTLDPVRREVAVDDFYVVRMWRFDGRRKLGKPVATTGLRALCPGFGALAGWPHGCATRLENGPHGPEQTVVLPWLFPPLSYPPDAPGQYIEISDVRNGEYVIEIQIDPKNHIRESYERDNRTCNVIRLRGTKVYELRNDFCWRRRT